ncbi:MAG: SMC family ATPase, partial [Cyanobacteria bacterium J06641_5]
MQPIKLSVRGFTSFKADQDLDFTALDSLFVITGPHGAGKSSILDAISFALFGKVPRDLTPKDLLSQGRDRLIVSFEFICSGDRYKVTRDYDFKTKSGKNVVTLEKPKSDRDWQIAGPDLNTIKSVNQRISELLGIDAETFFKIVLLPQGEFAEFLQGTPSNRKAILEKLFPEFGIFKRMAELATQQTSHLTGQRAWVASQLERLQAPTETEMAELMAERDRTQTDLTTAETERDRLAAELKTVKELVEKVTELAAQEVTLAQLQEREPEIQQQRETLAAARQATSLEANWQQYDSVRNLVATTKTRLEEATQALDVAQQNLARDQAQMDTLQQQEAVLATREATLAAAAAPAQACDRAAQAWQQAQADWQERQTALETARTQHDRALAIVEDLATRQAIARTEMERYAPGGDRLMTLQAVVQHLLPQWETLQTELVAQSAESDRTRTALETCDRAWEQAQEELATAQEAHKAVSAEVEMARNHEAANLLRASLHKGDTCPVCNGTFKGHKHEQLSLTDALLSGDDLSVLISRQETCSDRLETTRAQANRAEVALTQARERHHQTEANGDRLRTQVADLDGKVTTQLDASTWDAAAIATECQQLQTQDTAHQSASEAYGAAEKAWQEARTQWQLLQQQLSAATHEVDRAGALLEAKTTARDRATAELTEALSELQKELGDLPYARLQEKISMARQDFDRQLQTARTTYDREREAQVRAETAAATAKTAREEAASSLAAQEQAWATALAQFSWDEAKFLAARQPFDRCQELEKILETYDRK